MKFRVAAVLAMACVAAGGSAFGGVNQTETFSPIALNTPMPFGVTIGNSLSPNVFPSLHSFSKAQYNGQWFIVGGKTAGMHSMIEGFLPQNHNQTLIVIDPLTQQFWSRPLDDASAGFSQALIDTLKVTNPQYTQIGNRLYVAGGYGPSGTDGLYKTFDTLTAFDLPQIMDWVKGGSTSALSAIRQINDPFFRVTGGEMLTTSNGRSHLVFGQDYPANYGVRQDGEYTLQVRSFTIVDNASGLSFSNPVAGAQNPEFRRRDLNVVPVIQEQGGQLVEKMVAHAGVFTPDFGAWTVPVTIDANGVAVEPDPLAAGTFKQGMHHYRSANIEMYSISSKTMHTMEFGGISAQYIDPQTGGLTYDPFLPFMGDATDIITDASGNMTQHLLTAQFPLVTDAVGRPLFQGTETEFLLAPGVPTFANGVINLDALSGTTLIGYFFGGIAADDRNDALTYASNELYPVFITVAVPEPASIVVMLVGGVILLRRGRSRSV